MADQGSPIGELMLLALLPMQLADDALRRMWGLQPFVPKVMKLDPMAMGLPVYMAGMISKFPITGPEHANALTRLKLRIAAQISSALALHNMTPATLAARVNVPIEVVYELMTGDYEDIKLSSVVAVAAAMQCEWDVSLDIAESTISQLLQDNGAGPEAA